MTDLRKAAEAKALEITQGIEFETQYVGAKMAEANRRSVDRRIADALVAFAEEAQLQNELSRVLTRPMTKEEIAADETVLGNTSLCVHRVIGKSCRVCVVAEARREEQEKVDASWLGWLGVRGVLVSPEELGDLRRRRESEEK
jgi:hypothetical protein